MPRFPTRTEDTSETELIRARFGAPGPEPAPPALPCANCGTGLSGPYCGQCGQHVADYHRSVWRFLGDFFDNALCWDNKFLRTVTPLVRHPGFLTQEFMAGRRARYVHPLRMFLFTSAVCLALVGWAHHHANRSQTRRHAKVAGKSSVPADETKEAKADGDDDDDDGKTEAATVPTASAVTAPTASEVNSPPGESSLGEKIQQVLAASAAKTAPSPASRSGAPASLPEAAPTPTATAAATPAEAKTVNPFNETRRALEESGVLTPRRSRGETRARGNASEDDPTARIREANINKALAEGEKSWASVDKQRAQKVVALASADAERAQKFGEAMQKTFNSKEIGQIAENVSQGIEQKLSWVGLALLPVFALLLRAVYWRKDSYYFAHLVFSLHYHTFLFLFWAAYTCAGLLAAVLPFQGLWTFLLASCLLLPGWYLFVALRRLYGEGPRRTTFKVLTLGALHLLSILLGVVSVGALAFFSARS